MTDNNNLVDDFNQKVKLDQSDNELCSAQEILKDEKYDKELQIWYAEVLESYYEQFGTKSSETYVDMSKEQAILFFKEALEFWKSKQPVITKKVEIDSDQPVVDIGNPINIYKIKICLDQQGELYKQIKKLGITEDELDLESLD